MSDKPAILKDSQFTVEEGVAYRVFRTGAIWMNKLFFSCIALLALWLAIASFTNDAGCVPSVATEQVNGTVVDAGATEKCTVWLTPTAKYLGAMAVLSFLASLLFGALGLVVGKKILETTPVAEEVGARRDAPASQEADNGTTGRVPPSNP